MVFIKNNLDRLRELTQEIEDIESELQKFFDLSVDMFCVVQHEKFLKLNKAWSMILGWEPEELVGRNFFDFIHPDDVEKTINIYMQLYNGKENLRSVNRYLAKDGSYKYLSWSSSQADEEGKIYASARDITDLMEYQMDLQKTKDELFEKNALYTAILDNAQDLISLVETDGSIIYASPSHKKILGYNVGELHGKTIAEILHPEDVHIADEIMKMALGNDISKKIRMRVRHKNGKWITVEGSATLVHDPQNKPKMLLSITREVSA